jgi:hypothetical protein
MPPSSSDLPPWLRRSAAAPRSAQRRAAATVVSALLLFAAGAGSGYLFGHRGVAVAPPPPPPAPVCPPAVVCAPPPTGHAVAHVKVAAATKHAKPAAPAALSPLPERSPMDETERTQALRAFAQKKGSELKECVAEPDRGPPLKLGAAFEIGSDGAVDFVQILGADGSPKDVRQCYAKRLKHWRFPEDLLRGEEKLLVNFVL